MTNLKYYLSKVYKEIEKLSPKAIIHQVEPIESEDIFLIVYENEGEVFHLRDKITELTGKILLEGGPFIAVSILSKNHNQYIENGE